jgi:seryl-tRNA synthetase
MMAQKKSDPVPTADEKVSVTAEDSLSAGSFVTTVWDQYEQSNEWAQQLREKREDSYINALREVIKFNKQYRNTIAKLYEQTKKTNKDMVSELLHQLNANKDVFKDGPDHTSDREELKNQLKEVTGQMEKLALTPIRSIFHIVDQLEDNFENNAESNVAYARERRNACRQVRKEYVKKARNTHIDLVERSKNSFNELVKTH